MMNTRTLAAFLTLCLTGLNNPAIAGGESTGQVEPPKGPHGGRLLSSEKGLSLEITIFEQGVPPEMRIFAYSNDRPLDPSDVTVNVKLDRLGGAVDQLGFTPEQDYLVSDGVVTEPHSFDVSINASSGGQNFEWQYENHEGRTEISQRQQKLAELATERAGPMTLSFTDTLFGVISPVADRVNRVNAPYPGIVESVDVNVGDKVRKGQKLASLQNTLTLQSYTVTSIADGEVTARMANAGDRAESGALLEITDLSQVWVELSAFPENIEKLATGQNVTVYDLHHHKVVKSTLSYIAPTMTGGHIARARAVIPNSDGHWRPGMHLKADVEIEKRDVPLAIRNSALQTFREMPVVFARYGNTFEVRMVQLGATTGEYSEILGGLEPGTEYVTANSFLIKADVLKDGASHDH